MSVADICKTLGFQTIIFTGLGAGLWVLSGQEILQFVTIDLWQVSLGIAIGLGMIAVAAATFSLFPSYSEKITRLQSKNFAFLEKRMTMPVIIFMSICAGVGEEALFRGGLQTFLGGYVPIWLAIALSSIVFMLIHYARPLIAVIIFIIGSIFGVIYFWTGSLLAVMIGHAVYDVYAFWFLKREMHRLSLFEQPDESKPEPDPSVTE